MANYTSTQRFVKLTNYLLLEYEYTSAPSPEIYYVNTGTPAVGFEKIVNGYFSNSVQILNKPEDQLTTNNVRDLSVVQTEKNRFITLDNDRLTSYLDTDSKLTSVTNLPIVFPSNIGVYYDTVKLHIISGYNFDNIDGVILQIKFKERTGKKATVGQLIILKGDISLPILNPNPIYLAGGLYDHYVQIKIPAYAPMCADFDIQAGSQAKANTLAGKISSDGNGFLKDSPVEFSLYEISQTVIKNRYENYIAQIRSELAIIPRDNFSSLAAVIQENTTYNYIEYFPTWEGNFLEDFIYMEGKVGNSYYVINEIEVKEQVGLSYITTYNFSTTQIQDFNAPYIFRPVLVNPLTTSFIVNYTMRLINKNNQNQIIRRSSFSSFDVSRYGRENNVITLTSGAYTQKVYNKVIQAANVLASSGINTQPGTTTIKKVPIFYKDNNIAITKENIIVDKNGNLISEASSSNSMQIYGQGRASILVDPFDNYYKFTVYNLSGGTIPQLLDLGTTLSYYLVFLDKNGQSVRVENIKDRTSISNPVAGQIAFKLVQSNSKKVLGFTSKDFYIVSVSPEGAETKLYSGTWKNHSEYIASNPTGSFGTSVLGSTNAIVSGIKTTNITNLVDSKGTAVTSRGDQIVSGVPVSEFIENTKPYKTGSSSILSIRPSIQLNTTGGVSPRTYNKNKISNPLESTNQSNNINITSLSDSISGKELQGTNVQGVINYYFTPGAPGSTLFKGVKPSQFLTAALEVHPKSSTGAFDPIYIKYCNALGFQVTDDPEAAAKKSNVK